MKISKLFFIMLLAIATVSCSSDDDGREPYTLNRTNFVDSYSMKFLEEKVIETLTFNNGSTSTSSSSTLGTVFQNLNYVFNSDGTFEASGLYTTVETVTNSDGSVETNDPLMTNLEKTGFYTLNPTTNTLVITDQADRQTVYEITQYTETAMKLYSETEVTVGNSTTVTTQELRFSR